MTSTMKNIIILIALFISVEGIYAQSKKRLQPGKIYEPGEKIYAPKYGVNGVIPEGWDGTLPREMEIFLLMPRTAIGGEIFTFANDKKDLASIREGWLKGANLSESIIIKSNGDIVTNGDMISTEVVPKGESVNTGYKGFVAAKCSPYGPCITCLGIGPVQFYDQIKTAVESFMTNATFTEPSDVSIYVDFDWKEFLPGKMLIAFAAVESGSQTGTKENTVHLCADGTFTADLRKKGLFKQENPQYSGRQSGTWTAEGIGEQGVIKLNFKKLPPAEIPVTIKDEKIFANGERYFAGESDKCK